MRTMRQFIAIGAAVLLAGAASIALAQNAPANAGQARGIQDKNNDGICDITGKPVGAGMQNAQGRRAGTGMIYGPADGTGNKGAGPKDGTGYGAKSGNRGGVQDGSQARMGRQGRAGAGGSSGSRRGGRP